MVSTLIWISGASGGIGRALAETVPFDDARVLGMSRGKPPVGEHLEADLADPASWATVAESFKRELREFDGERVVFFHAAGTLDPIGFAAEVDTADYTRNVILNSACPQVLGQAFVAAAREVDARRHLVVLTSGAARTVYPGWSSYGAGKAAVDQWVRDVGAEQERRGGVRVLAIGPGTVDTGMQERIRATPEEAFPERQKFVGLHEEGKLTGPVEVARKLWGLLGADLDNGAVVDLRSLEDDGKA